MTTTLPATQEPVADVASSFLLSSLAQSAWLVQLQAMLATHSPHDIIVEPLNNTSLKAMVPLALAQACLRPVVFVASDPPSANRLQYAIEQFQANATLTSGKANDASLALYRYPDDGFSPYDLAVMPPPVLVQHLNFLNAAKENRPGIYVISARQLLFKHPTINFLRQHRLVITQGESVLPAQSSFKDAPVYLAERLVDLGYTATKLIAQPGEFSRRGDILDIYTVNSAALRLVFFDDTVESLRVIDPETQRSTATLESAEIWPKSALVFATGQSRDNLIEMLQQALERQSPTLDDIAFEGLRATIDSHREALKQGAQLGFLPDGLIYYSPLLMASEEFQSDEFQKADAKPSSSATGGNFVSLAEQLPQNAWLMAEDWHVLLNNLEGVADKLTHQLQDGLKHGHLLDIDQTHHVSAEEALSRLRQRYPRWILQESLALHNSTEKNAQVLTLSYQPPERFQADLIKATQYMAHLRRDGYHVIVCTDYPQRVLDTCREADLPAFYGQDVEKQNTALKHRDILISKHGPAEGFLLELSTSEDLKIAYITDGELFSRKRLQRVHQAPVKRKSKEDAEAIDSIDELRPGDYVVHVKHGIGQFVALAQMKLDNEIREYLTLEYAKGDKIHVPVDQVNLLSRYRGAGDAPPKLSKMGGIEWSTVRKKVKSSLESIAKDLVALYAKRAQVKGVAFDPDSPWQIELEESFPYTETPDQWQAILDTKKDMESDKPMDRLICGDVGFGKTEVAIRAIFKAVLSGKQAAVLVPTTILAQQHFQTLVDRFAPYSVRVGLLSRFRSPAEQREIVKRLAEGELDVVVGTHRLLQKDIQFKDLGLLVIDEEHRFGVAHKEKIKHLRSHVDVLTLSATPIPRTLYMSLSGVREMSLINTPPTNRAPVQTYVGPYNPAQVRLAIMHELDRGGQVYFLHNRVQSIYEMANHLQSLVPEARIIVAHGQLNEHQLENAMLDFAQHQADILLCTTIIESGVDIPNANTMIIDQTDRFGLAQLYQIRGRVGRSDRQAYAFLYYTPDKILTEDANNRLRAIREFTALGSGYQIAQRDMEIRGVGNILGGEQHGHMVAIGFDLYCQMLQDSIEAVQLGDDLEKAQQKAPESAIIDLNVTALIPEKWVGDKTVKLTEYKRLAMVSAERSIDMIRAEWQDRFGPVPPQADQLLNLVRLRIWATELKFPSVRTDGEYLRISVPYNLTEWMQRQAKLDPKLANRLRWVAGVSSQAASAPTLQMKLGVMRGDEIVKFLLKLFEGLRKD
ncbi:MAG: transcription-repair coupling factor [Vampirovibrionales bacterium]|nr:transcription-repair coupling factor [Vampirovibrionales bacterium]